MPRESIDLDLPLESLAILDENGDVDADLVPDLSDELLKRLHRTMVFARRFDQRQLTLQRQSRIGTFAPVEGQEAAQVGAVAALEPGDWMVPSFRESAASIWRGTDPVQLLLYNAGYNEGGAIPEEAHDLPIAIPVGTQICHAAGLGYAAKLQETDEVVLTFFGDGATSGGDFHESLNFAAVFQLPVVFVCQNNHWAISTPRERQTRSRTIAQKALAYGMPGIQVDGNDVFAVHVACTEAVRRAREGDGPSLIECVTYRMSVHTTADDPHVYRSEEEEEAWRQRDPIARLQAYLKGRDLLSDQDIESLEEQVGEDIDAAWKQAQQAMEELGDPADMFDHVHAEPTPELERQRAMVTGEAGEEDR